MDAPQSGVITIVFTDIEGSMALWQRLGHGFHAILERHDALLRSALAETRGREVKHEGDGLMLAFGRATDALRFAVSAQTALAAEPWPASVGQLGVRVGIHTGEVTAREQSDGRTDYFGPCVNLAARVCAAGHGGQVLVTSATRELTRASSADGVSLRELGAHLLRGLETPEPLFQVLHPDLPRTEFPPLRTLAATPHNLPAQLSSFVGRESEIQELAGRLRAEGVRLVTLVGPGGVGKTRLALATATEVAPRYEDGVWFVLADGADDAGAVAEAVARALGLVGREGHPACEGLLEHLSQRRALLVLDNLERVEDIATFLHGLLVRCPRVQCLLTSRRVLRVSGEHLHEVRPLALPEADAGLGRIIASEAVALLTERARMHRSEWSVTPDTASDVARLVRRLDGVPLAIELAASRLGRMSVHELLGRLSQSFDLLVSRHPDMPARQRALRATIEWSYDSLTPGVQELLADLSVFAGGFTMEAAETVCERPDVLDGVFELCDHSLLRAVARGSETRYTMLESIHDYARHLLDADRAEVLRSRHASYFLTFAEERSTHASGTGETEAYDALDAELANTRAARDWLEARGERVALCRLILATADFMARRGHRDLASVAYWERLVEALAELGSDDAPSLRVRVALAYRAGELAADQGDLDRAERLCDDGLALAQRAGDASGRAWLLNLAGRLAGRRGDAEIAEQRLRDALDGFRASGEVRGQGVATHNLGLVAFRAGRLDRAKELYREARELRRRAGDVRGSAEAANNIALVEEAVGDLEAASDLYRAAVQDLANVRDVPALAVAVTNLGETALNLGRLAEATRLLPAAARALASMGSPDAGYAAKLLERLREVAPEVPSSSAGGDWRGELLDAARGAMAQQ